RRSVATEGTGGDHRGAGVVVHDRAAAAPGGVGGEGRVGHVQPSAVGDPAAVVRGRLVALERALIDHDRAARGTIHAAGGRGDVSGEGAGGDDQGAAAGVVEAAGAAGGRVVGHEAAGERQHATVVEPTSPDTRGIAADRAVREHGDTRVEVPEAGASAGRR